MEYVESETPVLKVMDFTKSNFLFLFFRRRLKRRNKCPLKYYVVHLDPFEDPPS